MRITRLFGFGDVALGSLDNFTGQRNEKVRSILNDFPWLWAILRYWSPDQAEYVTVKQDMADLKTILANQSTKTRFKLWTLTTAVCGIFNLSIQPISPRDGNMWAEVVMKETFAHVNISYIVVVDTFWGKDHPCQRIMIFRHPEKQLLNGINGIVESVVRIHGSGAAWPLSRLD